MRPLLLKAVSSLHNYPYRSNEGGHVYDNQKSPEKATTQKLIATTKVTRLTRG